MTATITCGYDTEGKFFAKVDGDNLAQIVQAPNDLHDELSKRLIADPTSASAPSSTGTGTAVPEAPQAASAEGPDEVVDIPEDDPDRPAG